jgi:hypothetical protein
MNLFELNARMAVKLNQSLDTLYELEYMEYSILLNIIKKEIDEKNESIQNLSEIQQSPQVKVNLPEGISLK